MGEYIATFYLFRLNDPLSYYISLKVILWSPLVFPVTSYRLTESFRLDKTFKVINSNCQPNTTLPTQPCPQVPCLCVF